MMRAQLQHPINWILILVAGAFFLILFIAIIRSVTDTGADLQSMQTFQATQTAIENARASPGIEVTGRVPRVTTTCTDEYRMTLAGQEQEINQPLFTPPLLEGAVTIWARSLEVQDPIATLTYILPETTTIYVTSEVSEEVRDTLPRVQETNNIESLAPTTPHAIILTTQDLDGMTTAAAQDQRINAMMIQDSLITYYDYDGTFTTGETITYDQASLMTAAIMATTQERYECGLSRAEERLSLIARLEQERASILGSQEELPTTCEDAYQEIIEQYETLEDEGLQADMNDIRARLSQQRQRLIGAGCSA